MLEIQEVDVSQLKPWEGNPRVNEHAVNAVARSVGAFGFNVPILCDQNLTIIAGHTRWKAAKSLGMATVPVIRLTMTESQRKAFAVADNKTAEIADWDFPKLREVLEELKSKDTDLTAMGYSDAELRAVLEPEQDFDWEAFDAERSALVSPEYTLFPVKVPRGLRTPIRCAVDARAKAQGFAGKDGAIKAGRVLTSLLGVANEQAAEGQGRPNDPKDP